MRQEIEGIFSSIAYLKKSNDSFFFITLFYVIFMDITHTDKVVSRS